MQTARGTSLSDGGSDNDGGTGGTGGTASSAGRPKRRTVGVLAATATVVLVADLVSKIEIVRRLSPGEMVDVVDHVLRLTLTRNPGAAFSIGTGQTAVFALVAIGVAVAIVRTARRLASTGWAITLGLLLGGALGNLVDRIFRAPGPFRGYVVDWIKLPHWPVFNLADSAIVCGGILAVILALTGVEIDGSRPRRETPADDQPGETGDEPRPTEPAAERALPADGDVSAYSDRD